MGNDIGAYRLSIGLFYVRAYSHLCKKYAIFLRFGIQNYKILLDNFLNFVQAISRNIHKPFSSNIQFLLILLLLLILDNDIHQNPGPNECELSVFHMNARSVRNKISYIEDIASECSILCITESHLDDSVSNQDIAIEGFSEIFRKDRNCFGGGVLVYVSKDICVKHRPDLEFQ